MPAVPHLAAHPELHEARLGKPDVGGRVVKRAQVLVWGRPVAGRDAGVLRCRQAGTTAWAGVRRCGRRSQGPGGWAAAGWLRLCVAWTAQQTLEIQLEQRVVHGCDEGIVAGARWKRKCAVVPTKWLAHNLLQTQHRVRAWAKVRAGAQLSARCRLARERPALAQAEHAGQHDLGCVPRDSRRPGCAGGKSMEALARPPPHSAAGIAGVGSLGGRRAAGRRVTSVHTGMWPAGTCTPCHASTVASGCRLCSQRLPQRRQRVSSPGGLLASRHLSCTGLERPVGAACR